MLHRLLRGCNNACRAAYAVFARREHQIVAFRFAPECVRVKIKVVLAHPVDLLRLMKSTFFIQIITRCNALCPVGAIRIDENGKRTVACGPQNGGGTPANDDAVTLFCKL